MLIGESEIDLSLSRATLARTASTLDRCLLGASEDKPDLSFSELMKEVQCANMAIKRSAMALVDRAMTASGGSAYLSKSTLSRLYRDVRACSFMQPFSPLEAFEYIGKVTLGLDLGVQA